MPTASIRNQQQIASLFDHFCRRARMVASDASMSRYYGNSQAGFWEMIGRQ